MLLFPIIQSFLERSAPFYKKINMKFFEWARKATSQKTLAYVYIVCYNPA